MALIPHTDLDVFGLCFGGNVFGRTADRDTSFAVLDGYAAASARNTEQLKPLLASVDLKLSSDELGRLTAI